MSDETVNFGILKKHKNLLLLSIQEAGFEPQDFPYREVEIDNAMWFQMKYRDTPLWYAVRRHKDSYDTGYFISVEFKPNFPTTASNPIPWDTIDKNFSAWLETDLHEYINEVTGTDLWAQIQSQAPIVSDAPVGRDELEQFTQPEQAQLRMAIKEFRQLVIDKIGPSEEHLSLIDNRLDYLSEQVGQLNRINWRSLAFSTLISITIALSLNNEQGKQLFELFKQVFSNVVLLLQQ